MTPDDLNLINDTTYKSFENWLGGGGGESKMVFICDSMTNKWRVPISVYVHDTICTLHCVHFVDDNDLEDIDDHRNIDDHKDVHNQKDSNVQEDINTLDNDNSETNNSAYLNLGPRHIMSQLFNSVPMTPNDLNLINSYRP